MLRCGETYNLTTVLPANACRQPRPALYPSPSTMKLQPDKFDVQSIKGMGPGWIELVTGGRVERIGHSLIIGTRGERLPWHCPSFAALTAEHLAQLAELPAEVLLLGSGQRISEPSNGLSLLLDLPVFHFKLPLQCVDGGL